MSFACGGAPFEKGGDWGNKETVPVSRLLEKDAARVGVRTHVCACEVEKGREKEALGKGNGQTYSLQIVCDAVCRSRAPSLTKGLCKIFWL